MESLSSASSRSSSTFLRQNPEWMEWFVFELPMTLQHLVVVHLDDKQLVNYLNLHREIDRIENKSSQQEMQIFLLDFLSRLEKRENKKMRDFLTDYQELLVRPVNVNYGKATTRCHFITQALGLEKAIFRLACRNSTYEKIMFEQKFKIYYLRESFPDIKLPPHLSRLLPTDSDDGHENFIIVPSGKSSFKEFDPALEQFWTLEEKFYFRLTNLFTKISFGCFHQVLLLCFELLESKYYKFENLRYRIFVWGCLAVSLASYNLSNVCVSACLGRVESLVVFESDKFDLAFFRQQVYSKQGEAEKEREMFEFISSSVPKCSTFFSDSLLLHIKTQIECLENYICEITCILHVDTEVNQKVFFRMEIAFKVIARMSRLVHSVCSSTLHNMNSIKSYLPIFSFYKKIFQLGPKLTVGYSLEQIATDELKVIELQSKDFLKLFVRLINVTNNFYEADFEACMDNLKTFESKKARQESPECWAELCFSNFVLLGLDNKYPNLVEWTRSEAAAFYNKTGHYRSVLLRDFLKRPQVEKVTFEFESFRREPAITNPLRNVDVPTLFRHEPKLKYYIKAAEIACRQFRD